MPPAQLTHHRFETRYLTLFGGEAFSKVCMMAAFVYLARVLGPAGFGVVEVAVSMTVFFVLGVESGMGSYGARHVAADPTVVGRLVPPVMLLRAIFGGVAYLAVLGLAWTRDMPALNLLAVNGLVVFLTPFFLQWIFQGLRQMQWVAAGSAIRAFVFVAVVVALVGPGSSLLRVGVAEVLGASALAAYCGWIVVRRLRVRLDWSHLWSRTRALFFDVWPLGLSDLTWACLWYSPAIIVGWMFPAEPERVSWVAASVRIVYALHTFVWLYFFNLLPNLAHELTVGRDSWRALMTRSMGTSMWPACLIAVGGTIIAPVMIDLLYGRAYASASQTFQVIVWMIPVTWFSGHYRYSLLAAGLQRLESIASAITAAATIAASLVLVPRFGGIGAAVALLIGGVVNALAAAAIAATHVGSAPVGPLLLPVVATSIGTLGIGLGVSAATTPVLGATVATILFALATLRGSPELVQLARRFLGARAS